jgi:hypothetical protein
MNDPEVTMLDANAKPGLLVHRDALEAAGTAIKLVMRLPAPLKPIADQVIRSASSVPARQVRQSGCHPLEGACQVGMALIVAGQSRGGVPPLPRACHF